MKFWSKRLGVLIVFFWLPFFVMGAELAEPNRSIRALGMGNAFTAVVDDADALFYNPAGLSRISGYYWTIMDPHLAVNGLDVSTTASSLQGASGSDDLAAFYGKRIWLGGGMKSAISMANFAMGGYDHGQLGFYLSNPAYPNLQIDVVNDFGFIGGVSFPIVKGSAVGFSVKRIQRTGASVPLGASAIADFGSGTLANNTADTGIGYGIDIGALVMVDAGVKPVFSFVWKNAGYTSFTLESGSTPLPMIKDEMIAGMSFSFETPVLTLTPALDFKYTNRTDVQLGKKIHIGAEMSTMLFDVRGGFHQGYYTLGAGLDLAFMRLDLATWGVELGEYPGQKEDRRYALQLTMELGLDLSFDLFGEGGKGGKGGRRRLKQRR